MTDDELQAIEARANAAEAKFACDRNEPDKVHFVGVLSREKAEAIIATQAVVHALVAEVRRLMDVIGAILCASDQCQGHAECAHSMMPWGKAREALAEFDNDPEALAQIRQLMASHERYRE